MAIKSKKKLKKEAKKNAEPNPSYQRDLIECFKKGYAQFPGKGAKKGTEEQRLADYMENFGEYFANNLNANVTREAEQDMVDEISNGVNDQLG